jgi:hypothetical protein
MFVKRVVAVFLMLLGCCVAATAQPGAAAVTVHSGEVLRGHFVQLRNMKGFEKPLKSEGDFIIAPQYGLIWNVAKPFRTATVITAVGLVQTSNGVETINLSARKMPFVAQLHDMIGGMLTGDLAALQKKFVVEQSGTPERWRIRLIPRKADDPLMPFSEIRAHGGRFVDEVTMVKTDGDADVLTFDSVTLSAATLSTSERVAFGLKMP